MSAVSKADVLETYSDLYDVFEDNKAIYKELDKIYDRLNTLPYAKPEIIRCKDCIYFDRYVDGIEKYQWDGFCADWARNTYEDWYCSRAERRTDDDGRD